MLSSRDVHVACGDGDIGPWILHVCALVEKKKGVDGGGGGGVH